MNVARWVSYLAVIAVIGMMDSSEVLAKNEKKDASKSSEVIAVVNGQHITRDEVIAALQTLPPELIKQAEAKQKMQELFSLMLNQLIDMKLLAEAAEKENLDNDSKVKELIKKMATQIKIQAYLERLIAPKLTEAALRARYDTETRMAPKDLYEIKLCHILVKDKETAEKVIAKLNEGVDFAKLAREYSIDKSTAQNGGEIGYVLPGDLPAPLSEKAFALAVGSYTSTPIRTDNGYHVIKCKDKRKKTPPSFNQASEDIKQRVAEEAATAIVADLRKNAKIERSDQPPVAPDKKESKESNEGESAASPPAEDTSKKAGEPKKKETKK